MLKLMTSNYCTSLCRPLNTTAKAPWPIRSFLLNSNFPTDSMPCACILSRQVQRAGGSPTQAHTQRLENFTGRVHSHFNYQWENPHTALALALKTMSPTNVQRYCHWTKTNQKIKTRATGYKQRCVNRPRMFFFLGIFWTSSPVCPARNNNNKKRLSTVNNLYSAKDHILLVWRSLHLLLLPIPCSRSCYQWACAKPVICVWWRCVHDTL